MKKLAYIIPRLSLSFLSRKQITTLRNRFICLYLMPGETVDYQDIKIQPGVKTGFIIHDETWYLHIPKNKNPFWELNGDHLNFKENKKGVKILKSLLKNFPFTPTDNYIVYDQVGNV